ncbi:MAG TPA: hypothetical protein VF630_17475 [Hymenobacter sp.]
MSQSDLALLLPLAWQNSLDKQPKLGEYKTGCTAGEYAVAFSGTGYARKELAVTVEAGVKKRVDGVIGRVV